MITNISHRQTNQSPETRHEPTHACNLSPKPSGGGRVHDICWLLKANGKRKWLCVCVCLVVQHLPVGSRLLPLVLLPKTDSKSTLRPREFCGCWAVGEAVNPEEAKRNFRRRHLDRSAPPHTHRFITSAPQMIGTS